MLSVTNVKGLLVMIEVNLQSSFEIKQVLGLCDTACSNSWISENLPRTLNVQVPPLKLTVHGMNSHQTIDTQIVELKLTAVHSGSSCPAFAVKTVCEGILKRCNRSNGCRIITSPVSELRTHSPEEVQLWRRRNDPWSGYVPLYPPIGLFWKIPKEYSNSRPFTVGLGIEWATTFDFNFFSTCFKAVAPRETDSKWAHQIRSWYNIESNGAYKQIDPRSATDIRAEKIFQETTYYDGSDITLVCCGLMTNFLPKNHSAALAQFKFLERVLGNMRIQNKSILRSSLASFRKITSSRSKSPLVFRLTNPVSGTNHTARYITRTNPKRSDDSSTAQLSFTAIRWTMHI